MKEEDTESQILALLQFNKNPTEKGTYLVYYKEGLPWRHLKREVLIWIGKWFRPGSDQKIKFKIEGWLGPLPKIKEEK
jgi:hypothetical protein